MMMAAFCAHFLSRQQHTFAEKLLPARRLGFGCHVEWRETIAPLAPSNMKGHTGEVR